jgi:hypothetical protein
MGVIDRGDTRGDSTFGSVTPGGDHSPPYPHGVRVTPGDTATASQDSACHPEHHATMGRYPDGNQTWIAYLEIVRSKP